MEGELIGINTAILSKSGGYQGVGFAIPTNMANAIMVSLLKHGKVLRGWLGVAIQNLTPDMAKAFGLKISEGVLVGDVTPDSPAEKAGMQRGDVVISINEEPVSSTGQLRNLIAVAGSGSKVKVGVFRKDQRLTLTVQLGESPSAEGDRGRLSEKEGSLGGLDVGGLTPEARAKYNLPERLNVGVVVESVKPGSKAHGAGIQPGDVIIEINRITIKTVDQFFKIYRATKGNILLLVYRDGSTMYLLLS